MACDKRITIYLNQILEHTPNVTLHQVEAMRHMDKQKVRAEIEEKHNPSMVDMLEWSIGWDDHTRQILEELYRRQEAEKDPE